MMTMIRAAAAIILLIAAIPSHAQQPRQPWIPIVILDDGSTVEAAVGTFTTDVTIDGVDAVAGSVRLGQRRRAPIYRQLVIKLGDCALGTGGIYEFDSQDNFINRYDFTLIHTGAGRGFDLIGTVMCKVAVELLRNKRLIRV